MLQSLMIKDLTMTYIKAITLLKHFIPMTEAGDPAQPNDFIEYYDVPTNQMWIFDGNEITCLTIDHSQIWINTKGMCWAFDPENLIDISDFRIYTISNHPFTDDELIPEILPCFTQQEQFWGMEEYLDESEESDAFVAELTDRRIKFIRDLAPSEIVAIEIVSQYTDDHSPCINAHIRFITGDVLSIAALWLTNEFAGAWKYWEHPRAKKDIIDYLQSFITEPLDGE